MLIRAMFKSCFNTRSSVHHCSLDDNDPCTSAGPAILNIRLRLLAHVVDDTLKNNCGFCNYCMITYHAVGS